jgi:hypothetical protein
VRRLNRKRRWAYEGAAGGEAFSGQQGENRPLVSSVSVLEKSHEFIQVKFAVSGEVIKCRNGPMQLTFSLGFRDSTAALVLLFAACCKIQAKRSTVRDTTSLRSEL